MAVRVRSSQRGRVGCLVRTRLGSLWAGQVKGLECVGAIHVGCLVEAHHGFPGCGQVEVEERRRLSRGQVEVAEERSGQRLSM